MRDLTNQPKMKERGFKYIHIEGPDKRGIDCALLYNPRFFTPEKSWLQPYIYENGDTTHATRGFLTVQGKLAGDDITLWCATGQAEVPKASSVTGAASRCAT